jgi:endogenous inhibitor of DNA gyrase (YacG/DUF329 family)
MKNDKIIPQAANDAAPVSSGECPMCGKPVQLAYRPFCSKRCSDLDLSRWLNGVYAVPARENADDDDEQAER